MQCYDPGYQHQVMLHEAGNGADPQQWRASQRSEVHPSAWYGEQPQQLLAPEEANLSLPSSEPATSASWWDMVSLFPDKIFLARDEPLAEPPHSLFPEHAYEQPLSHPVKPARPEGVSSEGCLVDHAPLAPPVAPPGVRAPTPPRAVPVRGQSPEGRSAADPRHSYSMPALHPAQPRAEAGHDGGGRWDGTIEELVARVDRERVAMSTAVANQLRNMTERLDRHVQRTLEVSVSELRREVEAQRRELEQERADKLMTLSALRSDLDHQRCTIRDMAVGFQPAAEPDAEATLDDARYRELEQLKQQQAVMRAMIEDLRREMLQAPSPRCDSAVIPYGDTDYNCRPAVTRMEWCEERIKNLEEGFLARQEAHESLRCDVNLQQVQLAALEQTWRKEGSSGLAEVEEVRGEVRQVLEMARNWRTDLQEDMAKTASQCAAFQECLDAVAAGHERLHLRVGALDEGLGKVEANNLSLEQLRLRLDRLDGPLGGNSRMASARELGQGVEAPAPGTPKVVSSPQGGSPEPVDVSERSLTLTTTAFTAHAGSSETGSVAAGEEEPGQLAGGTLSLAARVQQMQQQLKVPRLPVLDGVREESVESGQRGIQATRRFAEQLRARRGVATVAAC